MKSLYIQSIFLKNYRNFNEFSLNAYLKPMIIIGENGSGKTNILEAISLSFPGRGIRYSKFEDICKQGEKFWHIEYNIKSKLGIAKIETNFSQDLNKRLITFNGVKISANELSKFFSLIWLTPQMDGIFLESPKIRRKFFDRIVYSFDERHAGKLSKYEYLLQERIKILKYNHGDKKWLKIVEENLAKLSYEISDARIKLLNSLQNTLYKMDNPFPKADLFLEGEVENFVEKQSENEILEFLNEGFFNARIKDGFSGKSGFGPHKTDFLVNNHENKLQAKICSTGEQKALLISIILAQINLIINQNDLKPVILFDEFFVHLDDLRKKYLIDFIINTKAQIWITATDLKGIEDLVNYSCVINL